MRFGMDRLDCMKLEEIAGEMKVSGERVRQLESIGLRKLRALLLRRGEIDFSKLDKFLYWYQQLIAESLGKKGKGFLPLISTAPKDHHSLLQLYLDGPRDKIFYIFSEERPNSKKIKIKRFDKRIDFLQNKSLQQVKNAQKNAFIQALKKNSIPFREFKIKNFSENTLGEFFSYFMLETAIIGKLANIDPFNQPAVQKVKIDTKKLLV